MSSLKRQATENEIANATQAFWGAIVDKFPEMPSGDTQLGSQDVNALRFWANGVRDSAMQDPMRLSLPNAVSPDRLEAAVQDAMKAAAASLPSVIDENRAEAHKSLSLCARHLIHHNLEDPEPGTFTVHIYASKEEWDACKGASDTVDELDDLDSAIAIANEEDYASAYQVTVQAIGLHELHEPGEPVYKRFNRDEKKLRARP